MSFFAGRIGTKTVLSLNSATGGTPADHTNPNTNSIFHSDMPHVVIEGSHTAALADGGSGYFTCAVPGPVTSAISSSIGKVILLEVIINNGGTEYSHMIQGGSMGCGNRLYSRFVFVPGSLSEGNSQLRVRLAPSIDTVLHAGYYPTGTGTIGTQIARGTGAVYDFSSQSSMTQRGATVPDTRASYLAGAGIYNIANADATTLANTWPADVNNIIAPFTPSVAHNRFFVRMRNPPAQTGKLSTPNNTVPATGTESALLASGAKSTIPPWGARSSRQNSEEWLMKEADTAATFPGTPVRAVWHITNMVYTGSGYTVTNHFTGTDIRISKSALTIKGVNMMSTGYTFLAQLSRGAALTNRSDCTNIGANIYAGAANKVTNIPLALATAAGNPTTSGGSGSWTSSVFSLTKFLPSAQWYVDTRRNAMGNQWGDVWSPTRLPLKIITGNVVSAVLSAGTFQVGAGASSDITMGTWNLNMGTGNAVVCTIEFTDMTWLTCGGFTGRGPFPGSAAAAETYEKLALALSANSKPSNFTHQILTLPVNQYVPIYVTYSTANMEAVGIQWNVPAGLRHITQIYYLINLGNGQVRMICSIVSTAGDTFTIASPNMRVTIQRLT